MLRFYSFSPWKISKILVLNFVCGKSANQLYILCKISIFKIVITQKPLFISSLKVVGKPTG